MANGDISGDTTTFKIFTRLINVWYGRVNSWIWDSTGNWEYDDSNYTDLPIATTTLVATQADYEMPSTAQKVDRVEVLNAAGDYHVLKQIDKSEVKTLAMSEHMETAGMPTQYDLVGRSIVLHPEPAATSVTTTKGLKLYFSRDIDEFVCKSGTADATTADHLVDDTSAQFVAGDVGRKVWNITDTTYALITAYTDAGDVTIDDDIFADTETYLLYDYDQEPGFVSNFHRILSLGAAYDYAASYNMPNKLVYLKGQIDEIVEELKGFYGTRNRGKKSRISPTRRNYK